MTSPLSSLNSTCDKTQRKVFDCIENRRDAVWMQWSAMWSDSMHQFRAKSTTGTSNSEQAMLFIKLLHRTIAQIIVASPKWKFNASFVVHSLSRAGRWNLQFIFSRTESQVFSLQVYASFMNTGRDMTGGETPSSDPTSGAKTPLSRELNTQLSFQKEQSTWKTTHLVHKNATSLANKEWGDVLYSCMHNIIFLNKSEPQLLKPGGLEPSFKAGIKSNEYVFYLWNIIQYFDYYLFLRFI